MGVCASGASVKSPLTGDELVDVSLNAYNTITGTTSHWWDTLFGPFIPHFVQVSDLCALNPDQPTFPDVTDILAALTRDPYAINKLTQYWSDLFTYAQFSKNCVCNSPGAFSCTTLMTHPVTLATFNGDVQTYGFGVEFVPSADVWCYGGWLKVHTVGTGVVQHGIQESGGAGLSYLENVTPTTTDTVYAFTSPQRLLSGHTYKYFYQFVGAGWTVDYTGSNNTPSTTSFATYTQHVYKSPIAGAWTVHSNSTTQPDPIFCPPAGTPPLPDEPIHDPDIIVPVTPTCTTTADLCTLINRLATRLDWMWRDLWIVQQQIAPFEYVEGTVHSGLTGSGSFAVSGILGYIVSLTTVPSGWGTSSDNPPRYIPAPGSVSMSDALGDQSADFINNPDQTVLRPAIGVGSTLKYHFKSGVTASITELLRRL